MSEISILRRDERAGYQLRELYRRHGYTLYRMSKFEEYDLYVRNKSFLVSEHILTFTDTDGRLMALKPDVTLSIVKNSPDAPGATQKVCYNENRLPHLPRRRGIPGDHAGRSGVHRGLGRLHRRRGPGPGR